MFLFSLSQRLPADTGRGNSFSSVFFLSDSKHPKACCFLVLGLLWPFSKQAMFNKWKGHKIKHKKKLNGQGGTMQPGNRMWLKKLNVGTMGCKELQRTGRSYMNTMTGKAHWCSLRASSRFRWFCLTQDTQMVLCTILPSILPQSLQLSKCSE